MRFSHSLVAAALLGAACAAGAQDKPAEDPLQTLRGFRIGSQCLNLEATFDGLRKEGFKASPAHFLCLSQPGQYHTERVLREEDGKQELIEVDFAPDSTLWHTKVSLTWEGIYKLNEHPSVDQLQASLRKRFGTPFVFTNDRALLTQATPGTTHAVSFAWASKPPADGPGQSPVDSFGWGRWSSDLKGTVTEATLRWSDDSSRVSLVVEMTNQWMVPLALAARADDQRAADARHADADASKLGKL
jgi:hypothetical protein